MLLRRIRASASNRTSAAAGFHNLALFTSSSSAARCRQQKPLPTQIRPFHNQVLGGHMSLLHNSSFSSSSLQQFGFSSSASPQPDEKDAAKKSENGSSEESGRAEVSDQTKSSASGKTSAEEDDSGSDSDLSMEDLVKLVSEKEETLKVKNMEIETMKDKVLRTYAEMENVMDRTRREAENSKKFAIQNFAKSLLDVADNMSRASSVVKDSFAKIDTSKDSAGAVPLLKTLLEGVEMTEKQLAEVFKKFGVEKYDPTNEQFDPHRHNAVFQVPDPSKDPDTVAVVLKPGYTLHERILRPAEVGVTIATDKESS